MRDMSCTGIRGVPGLRKQPRESAYDRLEDRRALVAGGDQHRTVVAGQPLVIDHLPLWVVELVQKGRRVAGHHGAHLFGHLGPAARAESHLFHKQLCGAGVVTGCDAATHLRQRSRGGGGRALVEKAEERRFVHDYSPQEVGPSCRELQRDDGPRRAAHHPRGRQAEPLDQGSKVGHVLRDVPLSRRTFAVAVTATVVGDHPEAIGQGRDDRIPVVVRAPLGRGPARVELSAPPLSAYAIRTPLTAMNCQPVLMLAGLLSLPS